MAAAETKRNSMAGRIATPRSMAAQGPNEGADLALSKAIGSRISITTTANSTIEGTLFTACPITNLVAINTASVASPGDFRIVPIPHIQSFKLLSLPEGTGVDNATPPLVRLDTRALEARESAAIRKIKEHDATRGKGVSKEAQDIFDALGRMLPARWHETAMVINDNVLIQAPYGLDDCSAPKGQEKSLERVRRVLENERRKLADRSKKSTPTPPPPAGGPRKGG